MSETGVIPDAAHNAVATAGPAVAARATIFAESLIGFHGEKDVCPDDRRMPLGRTTSSAEARRLTEQALDEWNLTDHADDVLLVTTELVQNLTQHTDDGGELHLQRRADAVLIEVTDTDPEPPTLVFPDPSAPGGRGLFIVAAIARRWGIRPARWAGHTGKVIWAEVGRPFSTPDHPEHLRPEPAHSPPTRHPEAA